MPSSRYDLIPDVLNIVTQLQPKSILDCGIGYGKYGVLFREYLDIWKVDKPYSERILKLYGVEVFKDYRNPIWDLYDEVWEENIFLIWDQLPKVDLLFLGDIIEHFTKEDGKKLLDVLDYKHAIILTPLEVSQQEEVYKNKFERHISSWGKEDFKNAQTIIINNQQLIFITK
jgi:hypothetical protein